MAELEVRDAIKSGVRGIAKEGVPMERKRQMAWRGVASMVVALTWVIFIVLFALSWAPSLGLFQNVVILIASLVAAFVFVGIMWMAYGIRYGWEA